MSDFGDFDNDDAFDTEPADPEQVARLYRRFEREQNSAIPDWDELTEGEKLRLIALMVRLVALLRRQGAFR